VKTKGNYGFELNGGFNSFLSLNFHDKAAFEMYFEELIVYHFHNLRKLGK